jgi:hypothetical protein
MLVVRLVRYYMAAKGPTLWNFKGLFPPALDAIAPGAGPDSNVVIVANSTLPSNFEQIWKTCTLPPLAFDAVYRNLKVATTFSCQKAIFRVCADGGANKLYDTIPEPLKRKFVPNQIAFSEAIIFCSHFLRVGFFFY